MNLREELKREIQIFVIVSFLSTCFFFLTITTLFQQYKIPVFAQILDINPTPTMTLTPSETPPSYTTVPLPTAFDSPTGIPLTAAPTTNEVIYPAQLLNLSNWKLTLPTGKSESPTEIKQPELAKFVKDPWFILSSDGGVRFRAAVNGVTTSGSGYPRSELREMKDDGKTNASWSSTSGTHTMFIDQAITAVPQTKKHVVAGQIHDSSDDVIVIRLEYPKLYVNADGKNKFELDSNYTLGKKFSVKFEVKDGQTKIFYNNSVDSVYTLSKKYSKAYFKAGTYTQSNCSKEGSGNCNDSNFGEVVIYNLSITHQ